MKRLRRSSRPSAGDHRPRPGACGHRYRRQAHHDADGWVAATAIRLGVPLVSNDGIFANAPGLALETLGGD